MARKSLIHCGRVLKPHGLKGEICTLWFADSPLLVNGLPRLFLRLPGCSPKVYNISAFRKHRDSYLIFLKNIQGRDQAEKLRGADILVDSRFLPDLQEDQAFVFEILGSRVFLSGNIYLGRLEDVVDNRGSEVWRIMTDNDQEVLFPANEQFIVDIDTENKHIVIDPPEGLLEIYGVSA